MHNIKSCQPSIWPGLSACFGSCHSPPGAVATQSARMGLPKLLETVGQETRDHYLVLSGKWNKVKPQNAPSDPFPENSAHDFLFLSRSCPDSTGTRSNTSANQTRSRPQTLDAVKHQGDGQLLVPNDRGNNGWRSGAEDLSQGML